MILRCLACNSPIFGGSCLCKQSVVRCPDCEGDGKKKSIELLTGDAYWGYIRKTQRERCPVCLGKGKVRVMYKPLVDEE